MKEGGLFGCGEREVDHLLYPIPSQDAGEGESEVIEAVLAGEDGRERDNLTTISRDGLDNVAHCRTNTVIGRTLATNDFVGILTGLIERPS